MEVVGFVPSDQKASNFILSAPEFLWSSTYFFFRFSLAIKFTISKALPFTVEQNCTWQFPVTLCRDSHKFLLQIQKDAFKIKKIESGIWESRFCHLNLYKAVAPAVFLTPFRLSCMQCSDHCSLCCTLSADSIVSYAIISCHLNIWFPYLRNTLDSTTG